MYPRDAGILAVGFGHFSLRRKGAPDWSASLQLKKSRSWWPNLSRPLGRTKSDS
jgi:hypothetical protein